MLVYNKQMNIFSMGGIQFHITDFLTVDLDRAGCVYSFEIIVRVLPVLYRDSTWRNTGLLGLDGMKASMKLLCGGLGSNAVIVVLRQWNTFQSLWWTGHESLTSMRGLCNCIEIHQGNVNNDLSIFVVLKAIFNLQS